MKFLLIALLSASCLGAMAGCDSNPTPHPGQQTTGADDPKGDASGGYTDTGSPAEQDPDDDLDPDPASPNDGRGEPCDETGATDDAGGGFAGGAEANDAAGASDGAAPADVGADGDATPEDGDEDGDDDNTTTTEEDCAAPSPSNDNDNVVEGR